MKRLLRYKFSAVLGVLLALSFLLGACDLLPADMRNELERAKQLASELVPQSGAATQGQTSGRGSNPEVRIVQVKVTKVSDGDTIRATVDGKNQRIRMIGINTPEIAHPADGIEEQYYGPEAFAYTQKQLEGKTVYLSFDKEMYDQYGRILAYVWLKNPKGYEEDFAFAQEQQFNAQLLAQGYAKFVRIAPNLTFAKIYKELADAARKAKLGLWAKEN